MQSLDSNKFLDLVMSRPPESAPRRSVTVAAWKSGDAGGMNTPRRSGRFDAVGVLSTLSSAPPLPSPAITPRPGGGGDALVAHDHRRSPSLAPQRGDLSMLGAPQHSPPEHNRSMALDRSSWLPSPRQSFRFQGVDMSVLDASVNAKHQVLETQEPDFISKLESSLLQKRDSDSSVRNSVLPWLATDAPANVLKVLEEGESELGDLEAEIQRVQREGAARPALPAAQDMEVEEVWEALMMWCGAHDDTLNQSQIEMLGHGLDIWRVEGFRPVLQARNTPLCTGDVYLILNRVDDREGAIGAVDEAYHLRRTRVRTLWTMHFWIGREAHPLKAGVAAVLAKELCKVLKRHARPIREVEGEESTILRALFPKGINTVPGACAHGFNAVERLPRAPRLLRVQEAFPAPAAAASRRTPVSALVPLEPLSLHDDGCFVLDTEDGIFHYAGAHAPKSVFGAANQLAMAIRFREHSGRSPCPLRTVNMGMDAEAEADFWGHLGVHGPQAIAAAQERAKRRVGQTDTDTDVVIYRVDDLQDEVEVTEVQKGGPVRRAVLERGACLVVDMHFAVYVWKGKGATLDARNIGLQLARDLAGPREVAAKDGEGRVASVCPVVVLASDCDDALFLSKFVDTQWVVYADLAQTSRIAASSNTKPKETSVRKMHSVTVRSWLETGQAVRKYNKSAMFVQQGALSGLKAWSVDNFSLSAVTSDMVGHFVMDRSYLIQCTYCADGMVDRHVIYFWQGWNCSRVESLVWQYDISALMANQIEKQTGSKPLQVRVQQGKEPAHLLALFDGSMVIHHTLASLPPSASSRLPDASDQRGAGGSSVLKEAKGRGRLYAVAGTHASRAYCVQVDANATTLNSSTCYVLYTASGAVFLWLGHWTDMQQRSIAAHVARRHEESAGGAFRVTTVHERQETREFWDALGAGAIGADYVCAGYLREVPWWRPRLFGCKAVTQALRVREVFDFVQGDLRHHKAMLLDNYNEVFLWIGPQCNAIVQRMSLSLAQDYISQAPDGRNKDMQVTVVTYKNEPDSFRSHFPYWLAWTPMVGDQADNIAQSLRTTAQQKVARAHGVSPAVLRQALHMLNKVPTRQRNALDLIVWKNHERAKWLRWGAGNSPFQNTFFDKVRDEKRATAA